MVRNVDADSVSDSVGTQGHFRMRVGELEGVLKQIGERRQQKVPVTVDAQTGVFLFDAERAATRFGVELGGLRSLFYERRDRKYFVL